jgi:hypothetical protein
MLPMGKIGVSAALGTVGEGPANNSSNSAALWYLGIAIASVHGTLGGVDGGVPTEAAVEIEAIEAFFR